MEPTPPHRLSFDTLRLEYLEKDRCVVLVVLGKSSNAVRFGACEGDDTSIGLLECAANATLRALASAAEHRVEFDLDLVRSLASPRCVVVTLSLSKPLGARKMRLCGSCLLNGDPLHAAAQAVLQATNRLFETDFIFFH